VGLRDLERRLVGGRGGVVEQALGHVQRHDARAAEDDDRRLDVLLGLDHLRLEQLELHAHRAQLLAQQEAGVGEGELVGAFGPAVQRRLRLRLGFLLRGREVAGGEVRVFVGGAGSAFVHGRSLTPES
jgi:hypothetical protein